MTHAPCKTSWTLRHTLRGVFVVAASVWLTACGGGGGGGGGSDTTPSPTPTPTPTLATVTSTSVSSARIGKAVVLTVNGTALDKGLTVASPGCTGVALSTAAPNVSSATTAYYTCTAASAGAQQFTVTRTSDSTLLSTVSYTVAVAQLSGTATVSSSRLGQTVLLTLSGTDLDLGLKVTSPGCNSIALSTTAPNISTATTAYYTCTAASGGAQQFTVARASDSAVLTTVNYNVAVAQVTGTPTASATLLGQGVLLTVNGTDLDLGLTVTSTGCSNIALSTTAPNVSSATTAYFNCIATSAGAQTFSVARTSDGTVLSTVPYTVLAPQVGDLNTAATTSTPKYGQQLVLSLTGTNLNLGLSASSTGCPNPTLSSTAPYVSTATTAYFTCTVTAVGSQQFVINRNSDNSVLITVAYTVPKPQVTLTYGTASGTTIGDVVITLEPAAAPITVNNFLSYVSSGFYVGTVMHRYVPTYFLQGGGYAAPVTPDAPPTPKPTNAPIVLEDNSGLSNTQWTVAMARTDVPDSATTQYFYNLGNNSFLDRTATARGYAVLGTVTAGTSVITAMTQATCKPLTYTLINIGGECLPVPNLLVTAAAQTR